MAEKSKIEWTDDTFNPWEGCAKVSGGCKNCYADGRHERYHGHALGDMACWGINAPRMGRSADYWKEPLKWNRQAAKAGVRRRVFCASLADVFERQTDISRSYAGTSMETKNLDGSPGLTYHFVDIEAERQKLWKLIEETPHLDWLLLTKRPENIMDMVPPRWHSHKGTGIELLEGVAAIPTNPRFYWPSNVWAGTSVEDQEAANLRIPHLLMVPAPVLFVSMEPLLGRVNLLAVNEGSPFEWDVLHGWRPFAGPEGSNTRALDWVILGGESGPNARHLHPSFVRQVRDDCERADTPFHFKQWGDWLPTGFDTDGGLHSSFERVGKHKAGRTLDGREHDGLPDNLPF